MISRVGNSHRARHRQPSSGGKKAGKWMKFVLARPWLEFGEFWKTDFQFDFGKIAGVDSLSSFSWSWMTVAMSVSADASTECLDGE
jgi:hypothetical protein